MFSKFYSSVNKVYWDDPECSTRVWTLDDVLYSNDAPRLGSDVIRRMKILSKKWENSDNLTSIRRMTTEVAVSMAQSGVSSLLLLMATYVCVMSMMTSS